MKHNIGDKVRVHTKEWFEQNCEKTDSGGFIKSGAENTLNSDMKKYCGSIVTIRGGFAHFYFITEDHCWCWEDWMFEEDDTGEQEDISTSSPRDTISAVCDAVKSLLLYKNEKYGNSALEPVGIFFQNKPEESDAAGILIRLDDKLGRIKNRDKLRVNDISDMIGYLTLLLASMSGKEDVIAEMNKQKD